MGIEEMGEVCPTKARLQNERNMKVIGSNVKRFRELSGKSQLEVAFYMETEQGLISLLETGKYANTSVYTLTRLALLFNVHISDFFKDETIPKALPV